jgi:H+-transporting ATPase
MEGKFMEPVVLSSEESKKTPIPELFKKLDSDEGGISSSEAKERLDLFGFNEIEEKKVSLFRKFLGYFWGPIPWMIEVAAVLSLVVRHWADFCIIITLLIFNALVGFWQEYQAGNAVEALKKKLALTSHALRDGKWQEVQAKELVPGDVIRLRLGEIIPRIPNFLKATTSAWTSLHLPANHCR